jgi:hypothetical protein
VITNSGVSKTIIWCCGKSMASEAKAKKKTTVKQKKVTKRKDGKK